MTETRRSFGFALSVAALSDVGRVRTNNEDSQGHAWLTDGSLFVIVADGMGGHEAGEVASGLAVQVVEDVVSRDPAEDPRKRLFDALLEANRAILDEGSRSGTRGMGTTAVTAILRGQEAFVALIGDSRCYHVRRGQLIWRSLDHTRVQMLVDHGEITEDEARVHPEAGMLTRALGHDRMADGRPLEPDVMPEALRIEEGDTLLLCSDGLHDLVEDWEIGQMIAGRTPEEAAEGLVQMACERGGHDNVTVTLITAGPRAGTYDPSYRPPAFPHTNTAAAAADEYTGEDYDTFDNGRAGAPEIATGPAPPAGYGGPVAVAAGPVATAPRANTAHTGVIQPATLRPAAKRSNKNVLIGVGVAAALFFLLLMVGGAIAVVAWMNLG